MSTTTAKRCAEAAATLRELLVTAASRGISIEDSFAHFDHGRDGVIDLSQFVLGLRSLGIPVSVEVGSLLLFQISEKSSTHLTCKDFHRLCDPQSTLVPPTPSAPPPKRRKRPPEKSSVGTNPIAAAQGLPQWAHDRSKRALRELQHLSKKRPFVPTAPMADDDRSSSESDEAPNQASPPRTTVPPVALEALEAPQYASFAINDATVLEYAILHAPSAGENTDDEAPEAPPSFFGDDLAKVQSRVTRHLDTRKTHTCARLIVVLDAFQTIAMMEALLQPFFRLYPLARVLVIGHVAKVAPEAIVTNATLASYMGALLLHLINTRAWSIQPKQGPGAVPQLLLGCGSGAAVAGWFTLVTAAEDPKLRVLNMALSALFLINGFASASEGSVKSKLHPLLHGLHANKGDTECHEQLVHLLFCDAYLAQESSRVSIALTRDRDAIVFEHRRRFLEPTSRALLQQRLKAIPKFTDLRPVLRNLHVPLILLQSSQNAWVPPSAANALQEGRVLVASLPEAFRQTNAVYVAWLKAGHEVLQERSPFCLQFLDAVVAAVLEHVTLAPVRGADADDNDGTTVEGHGRRTRPGRHRLDIDEDDTLVVQAPTDLAAVDASGPQWSSRVLAILHERGIQGIRQELIDRDIDLPLGAPDDSLMDKLEDALATEDSAYEAVLASKAALASLQEAQHAELARLEAEKQQKLLRDVERKKQRLKKEELAFAARERDRLRAAAIVEAERHERRSMDMEDEKSRKREDYDRKSVLWAESNRNALQNVVAELEDERKEALQTQAEINLGLERAAHRASLQAQLWELQRKLEANQVTLRGDAEGYALECGVDSHDIPRVLQGIECILHDAPASIAKHDAYNSQLHDCSRSLHNLSRALHRAETENVIAKPDAGGAVRLVQVLSQDTAQLQALTTASLEEVTMFDRAMQSIAILQTRTEATVRELLAKAAIMVHNANEELSLLRETQEDEAVADAKRLHLTNTTIARMTLLSAELSRIEGVTTKMVDSAIYVAGTLQRLDKATLERKCKEELNALTISLDELRVQSASAKTIRADLRINIKRIVEGLALLLSAQTQLAAFAKFAASTTVKEEADMDAQARGYSERSAALARERLSIPDLALVRSKKLFEHSVEEKEWIALDLKRGDHAVTLYSSLSEREAIEMRLDPLYQTSVTDAEIEYILSLPSRICLALPFLKSPTHLRAHYLLRKYTCGDGPVVLNQVDVTYAPPLPLPPGLDLHGMLQRKLAESLRQKPWASCNEKEQLWLACDARLGATMATLLPPFPVGFPVPDMTADHVQNVAGQMWSPNMTPADDAVWTVLHDFGGLRPDAQHIVVISTLAELVEADERATILVDAKTQRSLLESSKCQLRARKSATHEIVVDAVGLSLTVSIVLKVCKFGATGYKLGRLAAMLYHLSLSGKPEPIGQVQYDHVQLNTSESMGRIVLRHAPNRVPIAQGVYHIVVGCPVYTTYSIAVSMHEAMPASEFVRRAKATALTQQARLPVGREEVLQIWESMRLAERKLELVEKASSAAMLRAKEHEAKMGQLQRLLDVPTGAGASLSRKDLLAQIRTLDRAFTKQCKLHAIRQDEIHDIKRGLHHLASLHAKLLLERADLEAALTYARQHLPYAAARIEGATSGFKVAYALNAEYNVLKTAKMRWRDLAALKHQLPKLLTSAQRVRRKYKKNKLALDAAERQWVLLDRIVHPDLYLWEQEASQHAHMLNQKTTVPIGYSLSKIEAEMNAYSAAELQRLVDAPYNALSRKEILVRKAMLKFRDESVLRHHAITAADKPASILRSLPLDALDADQKAWLAFDKLLHPELHSRLLTTVPAAKQWTRDSLLALLQTPDDQIASLDADARRARALVLAYDGPFAYELLHGPSPPSAAYAAPIKHSLVDHSQAGEKVEVDVDARCRSVLHELDRAISSTNEFMDSSVLHSAPQRFPTSVLRLELEKELDRLLLSQLTEREEAEWGAFHNPKSLLDLHARDNDDDEEKTKQGLAHVSDSDSDLEARLAREEQRKAALKQLQKTNKKAKPSYQKQKRAIQDALVPRSIEEQQLELEKKNLGPGGCMACRKNPCTWVPYLNATKDTIVHRIHLLKDETERVKRSKETVLSSRLCMSAVRGGVEAISMRKMDLFLELTSEIRNWEKHLRLRDIDSELHATFNWPNDQFETVALHGFVQMQQTEKVKAALTREQHSLVAQLTTHEIVEDILEWMLEGWVFGERESRRKVQGFVPSVYKDGPLNMQVLRRLENMSPADKKMADELHDIHATKAKFGTPLEKWTPIEVDAQALRMDKKAIQKGSAADKVLDETEQALKFGLFCMTLMYFRGLSLLKAQKQVWGAKTSEHAKVHVAKPVTGLQLERQKQELRQRAPEPKEMERLQSQRQKLFANNRLAKREAKAATFLQRIYRGYLGRAAAIKWKIRRAELEARQALEQAAATTMQRAYRGRLGRIAAEDRRIELAEFIAQVRAQEAIEEEEAYWKRNRSERLRRRIMALVDRKAA
ncbi:hypothetical protein SPRG_22227 [Saprolegnia parasitica CBS 223.65]|uniref:EF-hand domain-containing protein n=1 Tax=Saprolegnia parasitica (strain CBS 223.65) TaxID=695850 RepID=A0A067C8P3_SAPPC|nr:hypothetical protein SPRG_22227 [Saprolegnia parasitica CBS 223.65]KDO25535.1 hypothetical protein SPRG_22227 [Saprolegnia parasitica CBS 223.65]|eukprot:XP_012203794.1 hypothetical protein SPRG_22227 [Saprolegnia parasitica CBS 223.65]